LSPGHIEWLHGLPVNIGCADFLAVHGTPNDRDAYMFSWEDVLPHGPYVTERGFRLCFFGHTHCPGVFSSDGAYGLDERNRFSLNFAGESSPEDPVVFINPGSVGQPRDGDPRAAYGIVDTEAGYYELVRAEYAVQTAADRIIKAGLPGFLAERLFLGR
jgi:diadenosine tetraphosphatase ApaH/serine/threonine PP2A family protein phosphatase